MGRNVDALARAVAIAEGFQDASGGVLPLAPARRNNPGSLRASSFASGKDAGGYAVFSSAEDGWKGLYRQIALDRDRGLTLEQFIYKFAPPNENRTREYYLPLIVAQTGLRPSDKLSEVIEPFPSSAPVLPAGLPGVSSAPAPPVTLPLVLPFPPELSLSGGLPWLEIAVGVIGATALAVLSR